MDNRTLQRGGYKCSGPCINNNIGYHSWSVAWEKCEAIESCTRIIRWENGSNYYYHLRKADDTFENNPRFLNVDFRPKSRGKLYRS